jgi:hypothetical protein
MLIKFLDRISKNTQMSNFTKILPGGAQLSQADGWMGAQTYITKLTAAFRHSANTPNNSRFLRYDGVQSEDYTASHPKRHFLHQCCDNFKFHKRPQSMTTGATALNSVLQKPWSSFCYGIVQQSSGMRQISC